MKIINFKKIFAYFNYNSHEGADIKVLRDWKLIIISFMIILIITSLMSFYIYWDIKEKSASDIEDEIDGQLKTVNRTLLSSILEKIKERENKFNINLPSEKIEEPAPETE